MAIGWTVGISFLVGTGCFCLCHHIQISSGSHPVSCPMDTKGTLSHHNVSGMWSWPLTST